MRKTANIVPNDPYNLNLLETFISNQKMIMEGQNRIERRLDAMEAKLCQQTKNKKKKAVAFTTEEVLEILKISSRTLQSLRSKGKIGFVKQGRTIWYTQQHIDDFLKIRNDIAMNI